MALFIATDNCNVMTSVPARFGLILVEIEMRSIRSFLRSSSRILIIPLCVCAEHIELSAVCRHPRDMANKSLID